MWIDNSAMAAWFHKSGVYSAFNGEVQTIIIKERESGKWKEGNKKEGKEKDSTMNKSKP